MRTVGRAGAGRVVGFGGGRACAVAVDEVGELATSSEGVGE